MPDSRDFDRIVSETSTRCTPLTEAERRRILALACERAGVEPPRRRRPVTVFAAVAAAVCAVSLTAFAAPYLVQMAKGDISFFQNAPSEAENPLDAPRGETGNARTALEAYNAPVGQSVTDAGVTITLDNLSMDTASMDAFFTITGEQAMEGVLGSASNGYGPFNVALPSPAPVSVTRTPVQQDSATGESRSYTVEQMKNGAQLPTSSLGGYTVEDYKVEGSAITMKLVPYGWPSANPQLMADDDGLISMAQTEAADPDTGETVTDLHSALQTKQVDPSTGVISWRLDYYAATEEQLNAVTGWRLYYEGDAEADTAHAVTLPLEPMS